MRQRIGVLVLGVVLLGACTDWHSFDGDENVHRAQYRKPLVVRCGTQSDTVFGYYVIVNSFTQRPKRIMSYNRDVVMTLRNDCTVKEIQAPRPPLPPESPK